VVLKEVFCNDIERGFFAVILKEVFAVILKGFFFAVILKEGISTERGLAESQ